MKLRTLAVAGWIVALTLTFPLLAAEPDKPVDPDREATLRRGDAYAHMMRALFAARRGEFGAAATEVHRALALEPEDSDLMVEAAELLGATGRSGEAERLSRQALEFDPDNQDALRFLADLLMARSLASSRDGKAGDEALSLYERLAAIGNDDDVEVLMKLIQLRHRSGDVDGAIGAARNLARARPGDSHASRTLAQLLLQAGQEQEALTVLLGYVAEHPTDADISRFAEQLAHNLEAWEITAQVLGPHRPYSVDAVVVQRLLGESLLRMGRTREAVEVLERARAGRPDDLRVRNHLALGYRGVGRMADAAALLRELIEESPDFPSLPQLLAETLTVQGDGRGALDAYNTALRGWGSAEEARPMRDAIRQQMALIYLGRDDPASAREQLDRLERPESAAAARIRGRAALDLDDLDDARRAVRKLRSLGEESFAALLDGEIHVRDERWAKAATRFDEAIRDLGPYTRRTVAEIYRQADRPELGRDVLADWISQGTDDSDAHFLLGEYLYKLDDFEAAETELRAAFDLDPDHAAALNFLGYSLAERSQRLDEALGMIQRALEVDSWNGAYLDSLGWVYYQMGRYDEARIPLEGAAREMPHDPTVLEHLGDVYIRLGDHESARTAWERALDSRPENADALRGKIADAGPNSVTPDEERRAEIAPPTP